MPDLFSGDEMDTFDTPDPTGTPAPDAFAEPEIMKTPEVLPATAPQAQPPAIIDFNNLDLGVSNPGVLVAETGTKVSRFPIERIKFTAAKKERISIITDKVLIVKTHFIEDVGAVICNGSLCCDEFGLPSVRYLFPIVHYECTDKKGAPISSDIDVKALAVGKDNYEELLTILENKGSLTQFDLVVTCTDEQYQKCAFTEAGPAQWKRSRKAQEYVAEKLKKNGKDIILSLGRVVNDQQLAKLIGKDTPPGFANDGDVNMDDIFKDS